MLIPNFVPVSSYPLAVINAIVALGLLLLHTPWYQRDPAYSWSPPFVAWRWAVVFFLAANVLLVVVPLVPGKVYEGRMPYWVCSLLSYNSLSSLMYWWCRGMWLLHTPSLLSASGIGYFAAVISTWIPCAARVSGRLRSCTRMDDRTSGTHYRVLLVYQNGESLIKKEQ